MGRRIIRISIHCTYCRSLQDHRVRFVGGHLADLTCRACRRSIRVARVRLLNYYTGEFAERVVTKPFRLVEEMRYDQRGFLLSLPGRVVSKPIRFMRELGEAVGDELGLTG